MNLRQAAFLLPVLFAALTGPALAQDVGRVMPASLPLPLPARVPMPPDQLRAHNAWNLPMTGTWRFKLTHGQIKAGRFVPSFGETPEIAASTYQAENSPLNAFDGDTTTRWCASTSNYPQWLQADLGKIRHVSVRR